MYVHTIVNVFRIYPCTYRVKSSSSSLFCRVCLGWAIFAQLGSDWSKRLMSSSLDQEALMVNFSSHWTIPLRTDRQTLQNATQKVKKKKQTKNTYFCKILFICLNVRYIQNSFTSLPHPFLWHYIFQTIELPYSHACRALYYATSPLFDPNS